MRFNRWTKGTIDRFYVQGGLVSADVKAYLEQAGEGFAIRIQGTTDSLTKIAISRDVVAALSEVFGCEPTWNQMVEACK